MTKIARIYERVSTEEQDLTRQGSLEQIAVRNGFYIAGIYREKASGARSDRPELLRMIADLREGDVVIAEKIDRITRLPLQQAEQLIEAIRSKGARLFIPGIVDLEDLVNDSDGVTRIVLESVQGMLLKIALQMARDDYELRRDRQKQGIELAKARGAYKGRKADQEKHEQIIALRKSGCTISTTARLTKCSTSQVKRVWASFRSEGQQQ